MFALKLLKVPSRDPAAAEPFWTALLGHPPVSRTAGEVRYDVDGLDLALVRAGGGAPGGLIGFELDHEDLDAVRRRLPAAAEASITSGEDGLRRLTARDPDGAPVVVHWRAPER